MYVRVYAGYFIAILCMYNLTQKCSFFAEELWLCSGDRDSGRLCVVKSVTGRFDIKSPNIDVSQQPATV